MNAETPPDPSPESNEQAASSSPARASRIKIGSQREGETTIVPQAEPETDQVNAAIAVGETDVAPEIPDEATDLAQEQRTSFPPPRIQKSSPELEAEIESALADVSIDDILGQETSSGDGIAELEADSRHTATVVKVHRDDVFFSLPGRHEGVASSKQLEQPPEPGTAMEVVVTGFNAEDGLYELRIPGTASSVGDWSDLSEGLVVEARITGHNTGGLECEVGSIRGFIPVSQISLYRVEDLEQFKDQKLQCVVTEANPVRRNLVLSHRAVLEREKEEARQKLMASLEVGQTHEGVVRNIREFGAFVDIGGVDGLIHISQLSWDRIQDPREVLEEGQTVKVKIDKIDPQTGKLSFSYRDLTEHPWDNIQAKYPVNSIVSGTVSKIMDFGAFVKLEAGVEGLVHVSELAHHRVHRVSNVVSEGQQVEVKVLSTDRDSQRMSLSIKAVQAAAPPTEKEDEPAEDDSPTPETYKAKRNAPLKGGTNQSAGGEQFGLNW